MKIKDLFKGLETCVMYDLDKNYSLFIERVSEFAFGKKVGENLLIELFEYVDIDRKYTDYIETINHNFTLDTDLKELTFEKIKQLATYVL